MKIILINPPSNSFRKAEEHLGLAYLKSFLDSKDFDVEIIDGYLLGLSCKEIISRVVQNPEVRILGVSPFIDSLGGAIKISREIKKARPDIIICWGGHLASFSARDFLKRLFVDCVVAGEGEITFFEIVKRIIFEKSTNLDGIKGIIYKKDNRIIFSQKRNLVANLDGLPFPDRTNSLIAMKLGALTQISGSRGCYGNCSFCSINSFYSLSDGEKWRGRSAKNIVDELEYLNLKFGLSMFKFVDDSFFGPDDNWRNRATEIAKEIMARKLVVRFRLSARVDNIDKKVFKELKQAGLYAVSVGVESGVQRALNTFRKGTTIAQNKKALQILKELGIITLMGFIGFDPYLSLAEVGKNISFLKGNKFCMSDIVSKPLYVHAEDGITSQLIREKKITGRDFPNYSYKIEDKKVQLIFECLKVWNVFNKNLFYKISDPLTSPRITKKKEELALLSMHTQMREIDIKVYEDIFKMVKLGKTKKFIKSYLKDCRLKSLPVWDEIEKKFNSLMSKK